MNLLVVTQYFWPENFRINDLVEDMIARGHTVTVLTGQPNYPAGVFFTGYGWRGPREETYRGARVLRVPLVARGKTRAQLMLNYLSFVLFGTLAVWFRLPKTERFDAIFVFEVSPITVGIPAAFARRKFGAPLFFWVLDLWPESLRAVGGMRHGLVLKLVEALVRWIYRRCDRILVPSHGYSADIVRHGGDADAIRYFPNWGEPIFDAAPTAPATAPLPPLTQGTRFMYAGNVGEAQDFPTLLDAIERLRDRRDIAWVIIGDGRMAPWVKSEVARRKLDSIITLISQKPIEQMPTYFSTADVLFLGLRPDPVFERTIPGKLQSYLAAAKPILAMLDGEGATVLAQAGAGIHCAAGDANALTAAILRMADLPVDARAHMGEAGRRYYETHFARAHVLGALEGWMLELATKGPTS